MSIQAYLILGCSYSCMGQLILDGLWDALATFDLSAFDNTFHLFVSPG